MDSSNKSSKILDIEKKNHFDVIIIGGGINGAAIARDASLRGLRVCLLEKNKCGEGTSSKSSKLAHGGLRYLEYGHFSLVHESLKERDILLETAPNYVKPLSFIYPVYKTSKRPFWKVKLGMWLYSKLARKSLLPSYKIYSNKEISNQCPQIKSHQLKGGALYYDAQLMDKELVLANIKDAQLNGTILYEQATVTEFIKKNKKIVGLNASINNKIQSFKSNVIINATGPWTNLINALDNPENAPLIAPTKGVHIIIKSLNLKHGLILEIPHENRIFFILPWQNKTLIGTTDTKFSGSFDTINVTPKDRQYLINACNHYLKQSIQETDILSEFAGLRPLSYSEKKESKRNRDFSFIQTKSGLFHLFGGKYTSYRYMAECAIDTVITTCFNSETLKPCSTHTKKLPSI